MRLFKCQACENILYFENHTCERCAHRLAYMPEATALSALEPLSSNDLWQPLAAPEQKRFLCRNAAHGACNWLVPAGTTDAYCAACRHNHLIPNLSEPGNLAPWQKIEAAKHRLFYSLLRWKLPLRTRGEDPQHGLSFDFLADSPVDGAPKVTTGHDHGKIVLAIAEADDAEREKRRVSMGEPYRTLLGHFRHEVGHHYWDILVQDGGKLDECRAVFGDDRLDYGAALKSHYASGPPAGWQENFVSQYATAHPWEDFAETWAHYLHMVDTLEMVEASGMSVRPRLDHTGDHTAQVSFDPYVAGTMEQLIAAWLPYVFAMNNISRAMGESDIYPFVVAPPVMRKLAFIHQLIHVAGDPQG
jgi:hypothetical protein